MLHFRMDMPFYLMAFYGSIMIVIVLLLRGLLRNKLPRFVFPVLWGVVLLRLLVPFSLSSPLSLPVPSNLFANIPFFQGLLEGETALFSEDTMAFAGDLLSGGGQGSSVQSHGSAQSEATGDSSLGEGTQYVIETMAESSVGMWRAGMPVWRGLLPILYLLGLAVTAGVLGWQKYQYAKRLRGGLLMEHNETVNTILRELGAGHVLVFTNDEIASPLVSGLLNVRIYLPTGMDFGNTMLLRHVLTHEAMHARRRDNWMKALMVAALVLNWYNPLVWLMAKCLGSDLEAACDAAVLGQWGEAEKKDYAFSLLAMAITGSRTSLLYSAFSKTEVERRVKGVLHYKKATAFALLFSVLFLMGSTAILATGGQAPFSSYLTSYCFSSNTSWGVRVTLTRDIALGQNSQKRAEEAVMDILRTDTTGDPDILGERIRAALAEEFGVERKAFETDISLCKTDEELEAEYEPWGLTRREDGFWIYQGEQIRIYEDRMLGSVQTHEEGAVDVSVQRDRLGAITAVTVWRQGDEEYDRRTRERVR